MFTLQRKSLIAVMLCLMVAFIAILPTASAAAGLSDPYAPKYVEISKVFEFKKGQINEPPLTYYYEERYPVGRFVGSLKLKNWTTVNRL
ncbi:hypothetical protein, partial [Paenibacillus elgii]|uniref:hypothetical protein n=1 Tax=Paenibacillus elgii TaxID=189691 RepID=UPI000248D155